MTEASPARSEPRIDHPEELDRMIRQIVERVDPVAIYLFGSRARGDARPESDYDLMLVLSDDAPPEGVRQAVWEAARSERVKINPFITRESAFAWRRHEVGTLDYEVAVDGLPLYLRGPWLPRGYAGRSTGSMNKAVVEEWLRRVEKDLGVARLCCDADDPIPDQAAYHVQQAAEKLTKAALVAHKLRPRKGHEIGEFAKRLPATFGDRGRFLDLERFSKFAWVHRYPAEPEAPPAPEPSVAEVRAWIAEIEALKSDFERWLERRANDGAAGRAR